MLPAILAQSAGLPLRAVDRIKWQARAVLTAQDPGTTGRSKTGHFPLVRVRISSYRLRLFQSSSRLSGNFHFEL